MATAQVLRPQSSIESFRSSATNASAISRAALHKRLTKTTTKAVWANLDGDKPAPLDTRFANVKKSLIKPENYAAVQASWTRLIEALEKRAAEIESAGPSAVPHVDFSSIGPDGKFPPDIAALIKSRGCCVVRGVVSREQALAWKASMLDYCARHPDVPRFPPSAPQMYGTFWQPAQTEARTHPNMLRAQVAMSQLYTASEDTIVDLTEQVVYADRFRVRMPGAVGTLPPHLDNGSIERWEDAEYSAAYQPIWEGRWEEYDAWDMDHRAEAVIDMYGGAGSCSGYRSLQGWLSMSDNGPGCGTIQLLPDIKISTAYVLLRPFFNDQDVLDMESTYFYGADPGQGQVCKENWHPHLKLEKTVVSCPKADPGDYVFWHGDMVHQVEKEHNGAVDSSVAFIPVAPLCGYNVGNLVDQRKAFLAGVPPPDMPPRPGQGLESSHEDRGSEKNILTAEGRRLFGLDKFDADAEGLTPGQRGARELANEALGFS
uniref:DUF1479 domain protein n=1 Tax=Schizophyllum commune (strain H4-8 / FGSC 9210) TaxID=578458 RepID=D8QDF4_SCHCM